MLLSRHPSHCAPLRPSGLGRLFAFSGDIKKQWELHTVDDVILVIPKNGIGARHTYKELAGGENGVFYQKSAIP